ncbi:MAG: hypothetical protein KDD94_06135, partial [Calditrichaeota bacterium]|nr:hypothetical protein [Calditrichota bacterium]
MNKFLSLLFTVTYLFSQIYQFQNLGIEDGLSQSNVYSILQDQTNILWFATEDGLNNYDGNNFVVFKQSYSDALQSNDINEIVQDSKGNIWIGTWGGGLAKFIPASGEFISFTSAYQDSNSLSGNRVQSLFIDPDSNLWIGTSEHGLNQLVDEKTKRFKHYNTKNSMISNDRIWSIESNKSGELWLATENGLNHLNLKTGEVTIYFRETANNLSLNHSLIRCLYFDHSGKLWVGTEDGLHQMLEPGKFKRYLHDERDPHSISHNVINVVYEDSFDQLWIGTGAGGLNKFDRKTELFHSYKNDPVNPISLSSNDVRDIFEDHSLNLWISTRGGGISRINLKQKPFAHLTVYDGLTHNRTTSIAETPDNKLWIGTREGISIYDRKTSSYSYLTEGSGKERLKDNYVRVLSYDRSGGLMWIGTQNSGLASYDYKSNHMSYYESDPSNSNSPPLNEIQAIYQDGDYLWIGTEKGLSRLNKASGKFEHYLHDLNNGETSVITITGNDNTIFVGADDFGIYILDKSTMKMKQLVHHPDDPKTLINDVILCMLLDDQYLWIGTERGLNRYQLSSGEFKLFDTTTGLANASILAILADDQNNLWLSTNLGISKLDKSNFSVRNYNQIDGLLNTSFIRASAHHASDGMLYFGAFNGLTAIAPKQFRSENYKYPVRIRRVKSLVTGKDIDLSHKTELVLPAGENFFTIEFIAMDFTKSSRNRYQYKLSGFDPDWINSGTRNIATYTNVEPDTYTFQVKGSNSFNEWNGNITELTITIQPHFYQTFWFKLFIALMVLKILYLLYWLRVKLIKNKNTELRNEIRVRQKAEENLENLIHELETKN